MNPLDQFKIKKIVNLEMLNYDISFTNSALFMLIALAGIIFCLTTSLKNQALIPNKIQMAGEFVYQVVTDILNDNIGAHSRKFIPLIFSLFMFILFCNLIGMLPYGFTVTSHISITFFMAIVLFIFITILGIYLHGLKFFSLFLPRGTPLWLAPLMVVIELFTYLSKPVSLSIRLSSNMIAGHVLLKVMAGFVLSMAIYLKFLPIAFIVVLIGFEIFIAILQAYIFTVLFCVYLGDAMNLH